MLVRGAARKEAVLGSIALGAERRHIVRAITIECVLIAVAGASLGVLLAGWGLRLLKSNWADTLGIFEMDLGLDHRVMLFVVGATLASAVVAGVIPALSLWRRVQRGTATLAIRAGRGTVRRASALGMLVGIEVASAAVLLVAAGLVLRSLGRLRAIETGFRADNVAVLDGNLTTGSAGRYASPAARIAYLDRIVSAIERIAGVTAASVNNALPAWGSSAETRLLISGPSSAGGDRSEQAHWSVVGPDYFSVLRIPVLRGRSLSPRDRAGAPAVVVVSETFAKRYFAGVDPVGGRIQQADSVGRARGWATIVGVVGDVLHEGLVVVPEVYYAAGQRPELMAYFSVIVRTASGPAAFIDPLRKTLAAVDSDIAFQSHLGACCWQPGIDSSRRDGRSVRLRS